jgi:hypothetical protein
MQSNPELSEHLVKVYLRNNLKIAKKMMLPA